MDFAESVRIMFASIVDLGTEGELTECVDGYNRIVVPLVAAWLGDREEHEVISSMVKVNQF